jgi:hypothetical protein
MPEHRGPRNHSSTRDASARDQPTERLEQEVFIVSAHEYSTSVQVDTCIGVLEAAHGIMGRIIFEGAIVFFL